MLVKDAVYAKARADKDLMTELNKGAWNIGWFIATSLSNHQRGVAMDYDSAAHHRADGAQNGWMSLCTGDGRGICHALCHARTEQCGGLLYRTGDLQLRHCMEAGHSVGIHDRRCTAAAELLHQCRHDTAGLRSGGTLMIWMPRTKCV